LHQHINSSYQQIFSDKNLKLFGADIFCGSGYGTNILAKDTNSVIFGIDASEESISLANLNFHRSNIFYSSKIFPFNLPDNIFDFICSFESLEHILDYKLFATQLASSLKNSGFLLISCPNSDRIDLDINPYTIDQSNPWILSTDLDTVFPNIY
jgi:2-polyprenyl-3-methyl-5-hydroxy-6-metoxy-1,4-benzoquinol methylase